MAKLQLIFTANFCKLSGLIYVLVMVPGVFALDPSCSGKFPAVFNFGDSNSDTGGLVAAFGPESPPQGMTFFHKPSGRFCDGRVVVDFLAEGLGLPYLDAYLQSVGSNFKTGANFATAGSTIRVQNTTLSQSGFSPFHFGAQVSQFTEFKQRTLEYYKQGLFGPLLPLPNYFIDALYTIDIGQNDLTAGYFLGLSVREVKAAIPDILGEFSNHIKTLHHEGAKHFLIVTTGPVGCLPYILTRLPYKLSDLDRHGCAEPYNAVARFFNRKLRALVVQLRTELANATFVVADGYNLKYDLYVNAHKHGFRFPLKACCGYGGGPYNFNRQVGCGIKTVLGGKQVSYNVCQDPSLYVNWDGIHYSEASNHIIANGIFSGNYTSPKFPSGHFCSLYK